MTQKEESIQTHSQCMCCHKPVLDITVFCPICGHIYCSEECMTRCKHIRCSDVDIYIEPYFKIPK